MSAQIQWRKENQEEQQKKMIVTCSQ